MSLQTVLRIASLCLALASAEMLHGIARTVLLAPRIDKRLALKLSIFSGSALAFAVCYFFVPGIGVETTGSQLALGIGLSAFMAAFDIAIGKLIMRKPWSKILADFNPASGNYLLYGLLVMIVFPVLIHWLQSE